MRHLQLYDEMPLAPVEIGESTAVADHACQRCDLGAGPKVKTICIAPSSAVLGSGPSVYLIGEYPGNEENREGSPFVGPSGQVLKREVRRHWRGTVVVDNAVRCYAAGAAAEKHFDACRTYTTGQIASIKPERIITLGGWAAYSVLGRSLAPFSVRRGYGWLYNNGNPIPVFTVMNPVNALRNLFVAQWFRDDIGWALTAKPPYGMPLTAVVNIVTTKEDAEAAVAWARSAPWFAFDTETSGRMFEAEFVLLTLALSIPGSDVTWVWNVSSFANPETADPLRRLMRDPNAKKIGQNVKFDLNAVLLGLGVQVQGVHGDTRLWRKTLDPDSDGHLEVMAELVGMGGHKEQARKALGMACAGIRTLRRKLVSGKYQTSAEAAIQLIDEAQARGETVDPAIEAAIRLGDKPEKYAFALIPTDVRDRYCARDALSTARLGDLLAPQLSSEMARLGGDLGRVWDKLTRPASYALAKVEAWGVATDLDAIEAFNTHLETKITGINARLANYGDFNPASVKQVKELLYGRLGLSPPKFTDKGAPSTDKESLEALKGQHPVVDDLIDHRRYVKLKGTYADGMRDHVRSDGRIHTTLNLDGARSGRLSSDNPNLQNIPRAESEEGIMARNCFIAPRGFTLLSADYSQLELRVAAMLSGDEVMKAIFAAGGDFHQQTAEMIAPIVWNITAVQVEKKHRSLAKTFVFGVLYGMSDEGVSKRAGCTLAEAASIRVAILGKFKKLAKYCAEQLDYARKYGGVWTWWDGGKARWRPLWRVGSTDSSDFARAEKARAEHSSWNTPIQGTASDFCLASVVDVVSWIDEDQPPVKLVLTVHDSIILEVRDDALPEAAFQVRRIMEGWPSMGVPIISDLEIGPAWGCMQKLDRKDLKKQIDGAIKDGKSAKLADLRAFDARYGGLIDDLARRAA